MANDLIIANEIKAARQKAGLTQVDLHLLLGIPQRTIEAWETGERTPSKYLVNLLVFYLKHYNKV